MRAVGHADDWLPLHHANVYFQGHTDILLSVTRI